MTADQRLARETEVYLGMCRRWREIPKPVIAQVHGACIAGGLMLAWICDFIVASDDAFFSDPVARMGIPGVEYFAHAFVLGPRRAKEILFTGERFTAGQALDWGMVNHVVAREELDAKVTSIAEQIVAMPMQGLFLSKKAVNITRWACATQWTRSSAGTTTRTAPTPKPATRWAGWTRSR